MFRSFFATLFVWLFFYYVFTSFVILDGHLFCILQISSDWEFHSPWGEEQDHEQAAVWQRGRSVVATTSYSFREVSESIAHRSHHVLPNLLQLPSHAGCMNLLPSVIKVKTIIILPTAQASWAYTSPGNEKMCQVRCKNWNNLQCHKTPVETLIVSFIRISAPLQHQIVFVCFWRICIWI